MRSAASSVTGSASSSADCWNTEPTRHTTAAEPSIAPGTASPDTINQGSSSHFSFCSAQTLFIYQIFLQDLLDYLDHPDEEADGDRQHEHLDYEGGEGVEGELVTTADISHYYLD